MWPKVLQRLGKINSDMVYLQVHELVISNTTFVQNVLYLQGNCE